MEKDVDESKLYPHNYPLFLDKVQNGAIPFSHESLINLFHRLEERFTVCRPSLRSIRNWPTWKLQLAALWLNKQTSLDRPSFMRRYR